MACCSRKTYDRDGQLDQWVTSDSKNKCVFVTIITKLSYVRSLFRSFKTKPQLNCTAPWPIQCPSCLWFLALLSVASCVQHTDDTPLPLEQYLFAFVVLRLYPPKRLVVSFFVFTLDQAHGQIRLVVQREWSRRNAFTDPHPPNETTERYYNRCNQQYCIYDVLCPTYMGMLVLWLVVFVGLSSVLWQVTTSRSRAVLSTSASPWYVNFAI